MGERPAYETFKEVVTKRNLQSYASLDLAGRGIYETLLDECRLAGSIPSHPGDVMELIRFAEPELFFSRHWRIVKKLFVPHPQEPERLISLAVEEERRKRNLRHKYAIAAAKKGGVISSVSRHSKTLIPTNSTPKRGPVEPALQPTANKGDRSDRLSDGSSGRSSDGSSGGQATRREREIHSPSFPDSSNTEKSPNPIVSPPAEKRGGRIDHAAEHFRARCLELTGAPYEFQRQDFVHLASLRKAYPVGASETPPGWDDAVTNYFGSPLSKYTIADLCVRYAVFRNSALDGFNKPIAHCNRGNGNGLTKQERNQQAAQRLRSRWGAQNSGGS